MQQRQLNFIFDSFQGGSRDTNKDGMLLISDEDYHILGVLDGVSSAIGAKKAVNYAIKYIEENHKSYSKENTFNLAKMVEELNRKLNSSGIQEPFATCSLVYFPHNPSYKIKILSLGDSRVYSVSKQYLSQLTIDHKDSIMNNILTKYLGAKNLILKDFTEVDHSEEGQSILICTDGFYSVIESNHENLAELHRVLNLKTIYFIKKGLNKVIHGFNKDDASYVFMRWENV